MLRKVVPVLIAASIAAGIYIKSQPETNSQQSKAALPAVVAFQVTPQPIAEKVEALGSTRANEGIDITANVTDKVVAVHFQDGDHVQQGDVLVTLKQDEERAQLQRAQVVLAEHQREFKRIENLVRKKTIAASELDRLQSLIDAAKANINEVEAKIADRIIRAPFSGKLGFRQVSVGALVTPGTQITTLDDISKLKLDFAVPESVIAQLTPGSEIVARSAAYPSQVFSGTVASLSPRVDASTRSMNVRAIIKNPQEQLFPGMLLKIDLIQARRESLMIPEAAIQTQGENHFVYRITADNVIEQQFIQIGLRRRGDVEVLQGLQAGDNIVLQGLLKVRPGSKVELQQETWRGSAA